VTFFEEFIQEVGKHLQVSLQIEKETLCRILLPKGLSVQFEYVREKNHILIAAFLGELPPGRFREEMLKEALKSNSLADSIGVFSYLPESNQLILTMTLYQAFEIKPLESFTQFAEKSALWKEAISGGQIALIAQNSPQKTKISPMAFK